MCFFLLDSKKALQFYPDKCVVEDCKVEDCKEISLKYLVVAVRDVITT